MLSGFVQDVGILVQVSCPRHVSHRGCFLKGVHRGAVPPSMKQESMEWCLWCEEASGPGILRTVQVLALASSKQGPQKSGGAET